MVTIRLCSRDLVRALNARAALDFQDRQRRSIKGWGVLAHYLVNKLVQNAGAAARTQLILKTTAKGTCDAFCRAFQRERRPCLGQKPHCDNVLSPALLVAHESAANSYLDNHLASAVNRLLGWIPR